MEELLHSILLDKWKIYLTGSSEERKLWLKKHLLKSATDLFSAKVLNQIQIMFAPRREVKAIVGNQFPEALAKFLGVPEMAHDKGVRKFNKLIIKEVIERIQFYIKVVSEGKICRSGSIDELRSKSERQLSCSHLSSKKPSWRAKGKAGIYAKYRRRRYDWFKEGIPKLETIPEATEMEEKMAEAEWFGHSGQEDTEESLKDVCDNSEEIPSRKASGIEKQPSQIGLQICDPSKSEENGTQDLNLEDKDSKEYVRSVVGLVMLQALKSSDTGCDTEVFDDLLGSTFEKVWSRVRGKKITFRIAFFKKYVQKVFSKLCKAISCTAKKALSFLVMKVQQAEEAFLSCFEKQLLKKCTLIERCYKFVGNVCCKMKSWMGCSDLLDSNSQETEEMEVGDAPIKKVFPLESDEAGQTVSSAPAGSLHIPKAITSEKSPACPRAASSSEEQQEGAKGEIKTALKALVKGVMDKMLEQSRLSFQSEHIQAACDMLSQQIWTEVLDKNIKLSSGKIVHHHEVIFRDILTKWTSEDMIQEDLKKPLTNDFKSCVIEHLQRLAETPC